MKSKDICLSCEEREYYIRLADRISKWIASVVRSAGMKGVVLGLSGGVDSAVAASLCGKALGSHVLGLIMPCESMAADENDALLAAKACGLRTTTIRLDRAFRAFVDVLPGASLSTRANLKPRLRMAALYYWANKLSYMVVGTGNKSELDVGYFTKYGDGGADLLPLGGLYKTRVISMARAIGVPESIVNKSPSAGLWPGQKDEQEMGVSYEDLDRTLAAIAGGQEKTVPASIVKRVRNMKSASSHKRELPPVFEAIK